MSWLQRLYETYEQCHGQEPDGSAPLMPICHTTINAHIEIAIDDEGNFRRAFVIKDNQATMIPCTEASGGRSGRKPVNHPLCDKLQYVAADFIEYGGVVTSGFLPDPSQPHANFIDSIRTWKDSSHGHWKVDAVFAYVARGTIVRDLISSKILPVDPSGQLVHDWSSEDEPPEIFRSLPANAAPLDSVVRWRVERRDDNESSTWNDSSLINAWVDFDTSSVSSKAVCHVTGTHARSAENSPARIRHGGDKAKLISSNDNSGYTFRGRFVTAKEAATVGFDIVQKAHNALRWLIKRQGFRNGDQVYLAWNPAGKPVPEPFNDTTHLFVSPDELAEFPGVEDKNVDAQIGDVGQSFAIRLRNALAGYGSKMQPADRVIAMGLDSATPGRMAVTFYRELAGTEFLARIESWHSSTAWFQRYSSKEEFVGAPSPKDIAQAAYGKRLDDKLKKSTVARIIPCIIDAAAIPFDLVSTLVHRAANRVGLDSWEFEKVLGIACALFRGFSHFNGKDYSMALENDNTSRDYLFGRLLAIAEHLESRALYLAGEKRDTNAARQMHRFADHPFATWQSIELALGPYRSQLRAKRGGLLNILERQLDEVMNLFQTADFKTDKKLTGEFLLAYHCQRRELWSSKTEADNNENGED